MPVRCPDCRGLAYRHATRERWTEKSRCGLTRAEAFAKARWQRDGWLVRALGQYSIGGPRLIWRAVQHRSDPDIREMGDRKWLGPWQPVGPPWTSYLYVQPAWLRDDGPGPAGPGPRPPPAGGGADEKSADRGRSPGG